MPVGDNRVAGATITAADINSIASLTNANEVAVATKAGAAHTHDLRYVQTVNDIAPDPVTGNVSVTITPNPSGFVDVTKTAPQSVTNSIVLVNDTALTFPIAANETWDVDVFVRYQSDATLDLRTSVTAPTGATMFGDARGLSSGAAGPSGLPLLATVDAPGEVYTWGGVGATVPTSLRYSVRVKNGATAGAVTFQFTQGTAGATATTVLASSNLLALRK